MHLLTEKEFQCDVEPILHQIFIGNDYTEPFQPQVKERLLVYFYVAGNPEKDYYWERQLFEAIAHAANEVGDTGCYLASAWEGRVIRVQSQEQLNQFAYISQSELVEAFAAPYGNPRVWSKLFMSSMDFCLCSESGKWGLLTTIDDHAFLGGSSEFMQAVKSYFPEIEQEVFEYLEERRLDQMYDDLNFQWLQQMLIHVYGSTTAEKMLIDSGLTTK